MNFVLLDRGMRHIHISKVISVMLLLNRDIYIYIYIYKTMNER